MSLLESKSIEEALAHSAPGELAENQARIAANGVTEELMAKRLAFCNAVMDAFEEHDPEFDTENAMATFAILYRKNIRGER